MIDLPHEWFLISLGVEYFNILKVSCIREVENIEDLKIDLDENDKALITEVFTEKMIPKLRFLNARIGTLNCEFAGKQYGNWIVHFRSLGDDFKIVEYEYDPDTSGLDLSRVLPEKLK